MTSSIEKRLQAMLNKSYLYGNNHIVTLVGYREDEARQRVYIHTNEKEDHFDRPAVDLSSFLKQFDEVKTNGHEHSTDPGELIIANGNSMASQLSAVLLENISRLQKEPEFIKQAQAITNNVNALVNLTKLQLDFYRATKKQHD